VSAAANPGAGVSGRRGRSFAGLVNCSISQQPDKSAAEVVSNCSPSPEKVAGCKTQQKLWYLNKSRVVGFKVYRRDLVPVRQAWIPNEPPVGERGEIQFLSPKSLRRLALVANNTPVDFRSMITLTYPREYPCDGTVVKSHLNAMLTNLRRKIPRFDYLWILEFQKRGAPHIHLFTSYNLPSPLRPMTRIGRISKEVRVNWELQDWISERWFSIVGSGDERHLRVGSAWEVIEKRDGMARYIAKEAYKTFQKEVPQDFRNVGRFWGASKGVAPREPEMIDSTLEELKAFLPTEMLGENDQPYPVCFGGAAEYHKVLGTTKDPVRVRAWKRGKPQADLLPTKCLSASISRKPIPIHDM
jgi:hypothetical protein